MQITASENSKRIAKNTLFLYFRSILTLGVGLYTSREVLAQLGVSDFGIYNVVGGVILLFSFIQNAMHSATSRFFTFDLGKGNYEQLEKTFSLSVIIHIFTSLIIFVLGETVGLWFLNTQLNIPGERMEAANFVYQFTIFTACIGILQMPYMVAINAHEKMKVYAYAGVSDAVFKLAVVLSLSFAPIDKLKFYSVLLFIVYVVMAAFYKIYCHRNFKETHFKFFWDKKKFWTMINFSGWSSISSLAFILALYGGNMLLNIFYGVKLNAAMGISNQVSNACNQFSWTFLAAVFPQLTKNYASGNIEYLNSLIIRSSKFAFFLCLLLILPLALNINLVLSVWLKTVPEYASEFCLLAFLNMAIYIVFAPIYQTIIATGKIKTFYIIDSLFLFGIVLLTYVLLHWTPMSLLLSHAIINSVRFIFAIWLLSKLMEFSVWNFIKHSLFKNMLVAAVACPIPVFISFHFAEWEALFLTTIVFLLLFGFAVLFLGMNSEERLQVKSYALNFFISKMPMPPKKTL
jgi:O-antigen/teichoic acid export membrane protein